MGIGLTNIKEGKEIELIILYPKTKEECDKEFEKIGNHKWLFVILNKKLAKEVLKHLRRFENKRVVILDDSATKQYFKEIEDKMSITRWINLTQLDGDIIGFRELKFEHTNEISILYCGMDNKEIMEELNEWIKILRSKLSKVKNDYKM